MRSRRTFLVGSAVAVSGALSGCAGILEEENSDGGDDVVENPNSDTDSEESDDSVEGESTDGESSDDSDDRQQRENIFDHYNDGIGYHNDGAQALDSGISAWNADDTSRAISEYDTAEQEFRSAEDEFDEAAAIAIDIGHQEAQEIADTGGQFVTLRRLQAEDSKQGAEAEQNDRDAETVNGHLDRAREHADEAEQMRVRDPDVVREILDLD